MAICGNCQAEGTRVRTIFTEDGQREECPSCNPSGFEKFTMPSDKKIWMGYEAHPNEYVKAGDGGYDRKPEYRAEQEQKLFEETEDERATRERAEAKKRRERRTDAIRPDEMSSALARAEEIAHFITQSATQGSDVN